MTDKELLNAIAQKDERAFNLFYERYSRTLAQFALKCTRDENFSKEIVQMFWIRVWERPLEIKTDDSDTAYKYLSKFFMFRMLDSIKEKAENKEFYCAYIEDFDLQSYNISDDMDMKELYAVIDKTLDSLPDTYKKIFKLLYVDEFSVSETAKILSMNERTVNYKSKECIDNIKKSLDMWYALKKTGTSPKQDSNVTELVRNLSFVVIINSYLYL